MALGGRAREERGWKDQGREGLVLHEGGGLGGRACRLWRFPLIKAETATNGAIGPPVAPIGAGRWRQSALGGGANRRWAVAPIGAGRWRQSAVAPRRLGGGAKAAGRSRQGGWGRPTPTMLRTTPIMLFHYASGNAPLCSDYAPLCQIQFHIRNGIHIQIRMRGTRATLRRAPPAGLLPTPCSFNASKPGLRPGP